MKILLVEDDEFIAQALTAIFTSQNYAVEVAADGQLGWELIEAFDYDLVLLDVMLPKLDGISLCRRIRSKGLQMPILLLTGRDNSHDKAIGLDAGADDYVVKPFDTEELVARVRALLRRGGAVSQPVLTWGDLQLDPSSCEVTYGSTPLSLTPKEYALLELFLRNSRRVFSCGMILEHLWSYEEMPREEAVRTHIKGLRQKLKAAGVRSDVIETVYGIGYRLKPREQSLVEQEDKADPETSQEASPLLPSIPANLLQPSQQQTLDRVNRIWHRFKPRVSEQVGILEQAVVALAKQDLSPALWQQAKQEAHTLVGSLGTFGLTQGAELARQIEQLLQAYPRVENAATLQAWVVALRQNIEELQEEPRSASVGEAVSASDQLAWSYQKNRPLLLIVDGNSSLSNQLVTEAATWGWRADVAANLTSARDKIFREPPDVVLLDPAIAPLTESLSLLTDLNKQVPAIPVVIFTERDDLAERLEVARLGGRTFVQKTAPPAQLLETVNQVLHQADRTKAHVMVVDDDPILLAIVQSLLEPWGLKITTLAHPQQFWQVLEATAPDLLILDIEMPEINGIELCQVVRNDARWGGLPILFLTAHTDADTVNQVFAVGADDFVSKPIVGPELVTRIVNRLERMRFLRNLAETDPLTRVATRQKSTQDLETLLRLAKRQKHPFCLAVLDLDDLKQINDRYGHATGDQVLYQVGQLLRRSFRAEDVVGRWGGEEFVVGLYGMTKQESAQRLNYVLTLLRQQPLITPTRPHEGKPAPVQATFSAGVAEYPEDGADLHSLYRAADRALNQAKAAGCDRVFSVKVI
jgi:diguanylate cyclase (GGDEF)-like protein